MGVVADIDGTLVGRPGFRDGKYQAPTLRESPCLRPLCRWLELGGSLLVVTSDDGNGPIKRVWIRFLSHFGRGFFFQQAMVLHFSSSMELVS